MVVNGNYEYRRTRHKHEVSSQKHLFVDDLLVIIFKGILQYTNSCAAGPGNTQSCDKENDYFAAFGGSGNVCGGVEFSKTAVVSEAFHLSLFLCYNQSLVLLI